VNPLIVISGSTEFELDDPQFDAAQFKAIYAGEAGVILLGNIPMDDMDVSRDMFQSLPEIFHESALLDRFHGFIRGRDIPRMNESLKMYGFKKYCLRPAVAMRTVIRNQLQIMDPKEFGGKNVAAYTLKAKYEKGVAADGR
jgi:hypothetical protein